jgi:hypothetical protein
MKLREADEAKAKVIEHEPAEAETTAEADEPAKPEER